MYKDRNNKPTSIGDILYYNEGDEYAHGIHEVIEIDGVLSGKTHLYDYDDKWVSMNVEDIIELRYYTSFSEGTTLEHAEIIGNVKNNPEMLAIEYA